MIEIAASATQLVHGQHEQFLALQKKACFCKHPETLHFAGAPAIVIYSGANGKLPQIFGGKNTKLEGPTRFNLPHSKNHSGDGNHKHVDDFAKVNSRATGRPDKFSHGLPAGERHFDPELLTVRDNSQASAASIAETVSSLNSAPDVSIPEQVTIGGQSEDNYMRHLMKGGKKNAKKVAAVKQSSAALDELKSIKKAVDTASTTSALPGNVPLPDYVI